MNLSKKGKNMEDKITEAKQILERHNQKHIIRYFKKLSKEQKQALAEQILRIDFEELEELYNLTKKEIEIDISELEPIESLNPALLQKEVLEEYIQIGEEIVKNGKLAVVTLAGGQRNQASVMISQKEH